MTDVITYDGLPPLSPESVRDYLAAWLDGALDDATAALVEELVNEDPATARLADQMRALDSRLPNAFSDIMRAPVPLSLARATTPKADTKWRPNESRGPAPADQHPGEVHGDAREATVTSIRRSPRLLTRARGWAMAAAAGVLIAAVGIPLAYRSGLETGVIQQAESEQLRRGWLTQVAQYHRAYSAESRHLVEVPADESAHITAWLGDRLNRQFAIPDLASHGLDFRGARLLIIDGAPVAQLMYAQADTIFGLCFLATDRPDAGFDDTVRDELGLVSWRDSGHSFVVVGPSSPGTLRAIAESARAQI